MAWTEPGPHPGRRRPGTRGAASAGRRARHLGPGPPHDRLGAGGDGAPGGRAAQEPDEGDWPAIGTPTPEAWRAAQEALFAAHVALIAAIREAGPTALARPVVDFRENALGTGLSGYLTLHGIIHHTVYHAGQIALLKRMLA